MRTLFPQVRRTFSLLLWPDPALLPQPRSQISSAGTLPEPWSRDPCTRAQSTWSVSPFRAHFFPIPRFSLDSFHTLPRQDFSPREGDKAAGSGGGGDQPSWELQCLLQSLPRSDASSLPYRVVSVLTPVTPASGMGPGCPRCQVSTCSYDSMATCFICFSKHPVPTGTQPSRRESLSMRLA